MKQKSSIGVASELKAGDIPKRKFGNTGEMLTVIGPGGARFRMISWEEARAVVLAIRAGSDSASILRMAASCRGSISTISVW